MIEIPELHDYIIKEPDHELFVVWTHTNSPYGAVGRWAVTDQEHYAYPMTKADAQVVIKELQEKYPNSRFEIRRRHKIEKFTLTKI